MRSQRIHLIAIGGSIMHNLALALDNQGHIVTGSDDQIFEPALTRLTTHGLLPARMGWYPEKITTDLDLIILGMHAKSTNPELARALELGIPIVSFPEYVARSSADKMRIVVAGSHGKTTTTSMLMHLFKALGKSFDYLVGAGIEGFDRMVSLTEAPYIIIEGDEYLSSCLDSRPKFLHYNPQIAIITGIAWDHYNVFPTLELYHKSFADFILSMKEGSTLFYFEEDEALTNLVNDHGKHLNAYSYGAVPHVWQNGQSYIRDGELLFATSVFGSHNFQNMQAVISVCTQLGFPRQEVVEALSSFKGSRKRMELLAEGNGKAAYLDFAHSPSKVRATLNAFREKYPEKKILTIIELHTYSSLNLDFLPQYAGSLKDTDHAIVYYDSHALAIKNMNPLSEPDIKNSFKREDIDVISHINELEDKILRLRQGTDILIFMGSGNFGDLDLRKVATNWLE